MKRDYVEKTESYYDFVTFTMTEAICFTEGDAKRISRDTVELVPNYILEKNNNDIYLSLIEYFKEKSVGTLKTDEDIEAAEVYDYSKEELKKMTQCILEYIPSSTLKEFPTKVEAVKNYLSKMN